MAKEVSLFDHNEQAYETLVSHLNNNKLAFIEHATGTGKSFILLKYLYTEMHDKRVLFITRHHEMLEQLFYDQMPSLGLSKEDFKQFDTNIYPNILDLDMNKIINDYDCIVWDEAHHCGAPKWSIKVNELKELVKNTPNKVMIGATATRIRYLDDYMDVAEEYFDGNVVSVLPVTRAILKNLLPAPSIIMTSQSCLEQIEKLEHKLNKIPHVNAVIEYKKYISELKARLVSEFYIGNILKNYDVKPGEKYIVFCSDINDLKRKMQDANEWFKGIGPVSTFCAHSGQKRSYNIDQIKEFSKNRNEISLMFAVDIFNEGFHIDGVDGILIFRKTKSPIVYWQQLGRALSFSARKKQIKIFDFANNTSDNKVVYELYKELLDETKRLIIEDPSNKELYEEILSRFQIVDQTTNILEKINKIDKQIDEEFIIKNRIEYSILKLEEYREFYSSTNFNQELLNGNLAYDYVRAYEYICDVEDYLTIEQIIRLQRLNITFTKKINLSEKKRKEILGEHKSFKELENSKIESFINSYVNYCKKHNRRPLENDDKKLYDEYRYYLLNLSKSKLNRLLSAIPYRLTLEENIILGNYPSSEDISIYLDMISFKLNNDISLDQVEKKVLKKLIHAIPSNYFVILEFLNGSKSISSTIDEAIERIRKYKNDNELFDIKSYKKALRTINRYANRITNDQFLKLLKLEIKLPPKINMTYEERLKQLNGYGSFYEKKQNESMGLINAYISFVNKNKRRPNEKVEFEEGLSLAYESRLYKTTTKKMKELVNALTANNIDATLEELVISNSNIDSKRLEDYILSIRNKLINNERVTDEELKILRLIERKKYSIKLDVSDFIKMVVNINTINSMIDNYESGILNEFQKNNIIRSIFSRSRFFTRNHIERLRTAGIEIPNEIIEFLDKNPNYINYYEQDVNNQREFLNNFLKYLEVYGEYPDNDSIMMQKYRYYLSYAHQHVIIKLLNQMKSMNITLGIEENILIEEFNRDEAIKYFEGIKDKVKNNEPLDALESRVCRILDKYLLTTEYSKEIKNATVHIGDELESKIVRNIEACIRLNPYAKIDLEHNYSISKKNRRRLEVYRINVLGKEIFTNILKKLRTEKKPMNEVVEEYVLEYYELLSKSQDLNADNEYLLNIIKGLNSELILRKKGFEISDFVSRYIDFLRDTNGNKPNINSEDEYERNLAETYDDIHDLLDIKDLQKIDKALKQIIEEESIISFYPKFISFINEFGRFPCGNSDNAYEVYLNTLFQNIGSTLTKEQNNEIKRLRKIYGRATILANMEFTKNNNPKKK